MIDINTLLPALLPGYMKAEALDDIEAAANVGAVETVEPKKGQRVVVQAYLPHVTQFGWNPNNDLVYGWPGGPLEVGDLVRCPGTNLQPSGWAAIVVSLDASGHPYKGPVRMLLGKAEEQK